jgi:transcription elongation factor Elf1
MVSDTARRWIEAANILSRDPMAQIACPTCGKAHLNVNDIKAYNGQMERILSCAACGAREFMLMKILH